MIRLIISAAWMVALVATVSCLSVAQEPTENGNRQPQGDAPTEQSVDREVENESTLAPSSQPGLQTPEIDAVADEEFERRQPAVREEAVTETSEPRSVSVLLGLASSWITALGTLVLAVLTGVLAWVTWLLFRNSGKPQIVASVEVNRWSMMNADLVVENTGNATAFDIEISFSPELPGFRDSPPEGGPALRKLSLLRPGQSLSTLQSNFDDLIDVKFEVTTKWRRHPSDKRQETLSYPLDFEGIRNLSRLGAESPEVQIAESIKKMREDWKSVASGDKRLSVDTYNSADREQKRKAIEQAREERRKQKD